MNKPTDLFGQALYDRYRGAKEKFYIEVCGEKREHNINRYFRKIDKLSKTEKQLIAMCHGNILDVGCATGNYIPLMNKKGNVVGIDISKKVIDITRESGTKNCFVKNIFNFKSSKKFDTITLLENNLGMAGSVDGTKKLLKKLSKILKDEGQILATISKRSRDEDFLINELTPIYKNTVGKSFRWIHLSTAFLNTLCQTENLLLEMIRANRYYSLIKITKKKLKN